MNIQTVNYTEKSIAVYGETYQIKDQLKQIGGTFNKYLTINGQRVAGWVFSKKREPELQTLLNGSKRTEIKEPKQKQYDSKELFDKLGITKISMYELANIYWCEYLKRQDVDCLTDAIAVELSGVHIASASFNRYGDKNTITQTMAKTYLRVNGKGIDEICELVDCHGFICTPDDIIEYMKDYPSGRPIRNEKMVLACELFIEHYGKVLNKTLARELVEMREQFATESRSYSADGNDFANEFGNDNDNPF